MIRHALLLSLVALAAPAAAQASTPNAKALKSLGVKVSWPLGARVTEPAGSTLSVKVRSSKRRVALSLVTLDRRGRATRALARRTLRDGTFKAKLGGAGTYALRLSVADRRYSSTIVVPAPTPGPIAAPVATAQPTPRSAPPVVSPGVSTNVADPCASLPANSAVEQIPLQTSVAAGGRLSYEEIVDGPGCALYSATYGFARQQADGSWQELNLGIVFAMFVFPIPPGGPVGVSSVPVPASLAPGHYRFWDWAGSFEFELTS